MNPIGITKILTAGDGFACNHIWPMWPHILQMSTVDTDVISLGKMGAGNEYIFNSIVDYINNNSDVDLVLVQWAISNRLDLIVDSEFKFDIIKDDPVYRNNIHNRWWLSSASKIDYVIKYHREYIGYEQHQLRTKNYIISLSAILSQRGIPFRFFSTWDTNLYPDKDIDWSQWVWHTPGGGMHSYSLEERFSSIRLGEVQPSPPIHLSWLLEVLRPRVDLVWEEDHIEKLTELFKDRDWHGLVPHYIARSVSS